MTSNPLFDYGLMQKKSAQIRSSNAGGSADPITGPMPNLGQYEIVDGLLYRNQRENHGHGNNAIGYDYTNPGAAFGIADPPPFADSYITPSWGVEVLPAPGASEFIISANNNGVNGGTSGNNTSVPF